MPRVKENVTGFSYILLWLKQLREKGYKVEYEYNEYAQDIYGKINGIRFTVGGIGLVESFEDDRILEYLVVIYKSTNVKDNTNDKYKVINQSEVIKLLEDNML